MDHAVGQAVQRVAGVVHGLRDQARLAGAERAAGVLRLDEIDEAVEQAAPVDHRHDGHDAVEVVREALGQHQAFASAF